MPQTIYVTSFIDCNEKIIHEKYEGFWNYIDHSKIKKASLFSSKIVNLKTELEEIFIFSEKDKNNLSVAESMKSVDKGFKLSRQFGSTSVIGAMMAGSIIKKESESRISNSLYFNAKLRGGIKFSATAARSLLEELLSFEGVQLLDNSEDTFTTKHSELLLSISSKAGWVIK